jgi:hypothetical protein
LKLSALRQAIRDLVAATTVPSSAHWAGVTTLRHVATMDLEAPGLDGHHLTFVVEHAGSDYPDRRRGTQRTRSTFDVMIQVAARISTIDGEADTDAGLDVAESVRDALNTATGEVPLAVETLGSVGVDATGTRYTYRLTLAAIHDTGA